MSGAGPSPKAAPRDLLDRVDHALGRAEGGVVLGVLAMMIGLSALQLVLRKTADFGFEWADILVRQGVLWIGFVGGALATQQGRHIAIDAACKLMAPKHAAVVRTVTSVAAAILGGILTWASFVFLGAEMDRGEELLLGIPAWLSQAVIPGAFVLITFHFLVAARNHLWVALGKRPPPVEAPIPAPSAEEPS